MQEQNGIAQPRTKRRGRKALMSVAVTLVLLASLSAVIFAGKSSIGDFVWHDIDADGVADVGELGINGVDVELYEDNGTVGVFEPGIDVLIGISTTLNFPGSGNVDNNGYYDFNVDGPGSFWVVITDTNFLPGEPLDGYVYTGGLGGEAYSGPEPRPVTIAIIEDYNLADFAYAKAEVELVKTAGNAADGEIEYITNPPGTVTYYYTVTNTGEVAIDLNNATIPAAGYGVVDNLCAPVTYQSGDDGNGYLDTSEVWLYTCDDSGLSGTITNTGTVTGNAVDIEDQGGGVFVPTDLPGNDVVVTDTAVVDVVNPSVVISKTVFKNPGSCPGQEIVPGPSGTPITYCFVVENTGDTNLDVEVDDPDAPPSGISFGVDTLKPGEVITYTYPTQISGQLTNTATVTGTPVLTTGVPITDINPVTDTDTAEVQVPPDPGAIGDYVWLDANKDGYQDVDEDGIGNVTVNLFDPGDLVNPIATTTTGADGGYIFSGLAAGDYVVAFDAADPTLTGLTHLPLNQSLDSPTGVITLAAGEFYEDADFGFFKPVGANSAVIGDTVWIDADGDGIQDPGEPGLPGVTVWVTPTVGPPLSAITDENGNYLIEVPAGAGITYEVAPDPTDPDLAGLDPTTVQPILVPELAPDEYYLDADFGYNTDDPGGNPLYTVGNLIWDDTTTPDGERQPGEPGIPGVTVDLTLPDGTVVATTFTDALGQYQFTGIAAGDYEVKVTDTSNVLADYLHSVIFPTTIDNANRPLPWPVSLPTDLEPGDGTDYPRADFAYVLNPDTSPDQGIIGNQIFFDTDGDGLFEPDGGDYGIEGVDVLLTYPGGTVTETVTSGSSGLYAFTGLPAGNGYTVEVADTVTNTAILEDYVITSLGPVPGADNNNQVDPDTPSPYVVDLPTDTSTNFTADFGYTNPGEIGDYVWWDVDEDGVQDPGEPPIEGVLVELFDENDVFVAADVTDADGLYVFPDLDAPENYTVVIPASQFDPTEALDGFDPTTPFNDPDPAVDSNGVDGSPDFPGAVIADAPLAKAQEDETIDFGFVPDNGVQVTKVLSIESPNEPVQTGSEISFTIEIVNTGQTVITSLPLTDTYRPFYLTYLSATPGESSISTPGMPYTSTDVATIFWADLLPGALELVPGQATQVIVRFTAEEDTTDPDSQNPDGLVTVNTALADNIEVDPDGDGPIPPAIPPNLTDEDEDDVTILDPTSVLIADANVQRISDGHARVEWKTANELTILGFKVHRVINGQSELVDENMVEASNPGQSDGASYSVVDTKANSSGGANIFYRLEIMTTAGTSEVHHIGVLPAELQHLYLPLISRQ